MPLAMVIMAVGQSECPLLASCRLTATGQSPVLHFLGGVAKAICIFEPIAVLIALVAENQGTTEHTEHTEAGNVGTTEHTEARGNRLRVVFRGRVEGEWYLSNFGLMVDAGWFMDAVNAIGGCSDGDHDRCTYPTLPSPSSPKPLMQNHPR